MSIQSRLRQVWNAFVADESSAPMPGYGANVISYGARPPDRARLRTVNERSIIASIYTRLGIDVAGVEIRHVEFDDKGRFKRNLPSTLNDCLLLEPNLDQGPRQFRQDIALTLFNEGVAALVAVDTSANPEDTLSYDIHSLRVGTVVEWLPDHVKVNLYNEKTGKHQNITLQKRNVAVVENPLYSVMNEPNSTLQRLLRKLSLLDVVDEQSSSGKLDLIIQLPYVVKTEARKAQAEKRREDIEFQLRGSQYGIAYTDGTEKVTQLNRPAENNLLKQVEYLFNLLYSQLGITPQVMDGTADEATMINYYNRTIEPILDAIVEAMERSFVGKTGVVKKQHVRYYQNRFKLVPLAQMADIADKFSRNEILSSNEFRGFLGLPPSDDPKADELRNSNMPLPEPPPSDGLSQSDVDGLFDTVFSLIETDIERIVGGSND